MRYGAMNADSPQGITPQKLLRNSTCLSQPHPGRTDAGESVSSPHDFL
jgi:hypothetical protein